MRQRSLPRLARTLATLVGLTLGVAQPGAARAESCTPLDGRRAIVHDADDPPAALRILIAADTQLQTLSGGHYIGLSGPLEDRVVGVSLRPPALALIGGEALETLLTAAAEAEKPDVILYLGDGANNGCADEIGTLLYALGRVRSIHEVPIFIAPGNHDYTGNGNSNDDDKRERLCHRRGIEGPENEPLTRRAVLQAFAAFNRESAEMAPAQWRYEASTPTCPDPGPGVASPMDTHPGCFLAGALHRCSPEGDAPCDSRAAKHHLWLVDTTDYSDSGLLPLENLRGAGSGISALQRAWFGAHGGDGTPIIASHYEIDLDDGWADARRTPWARPPVALWGHTHSRLPCEQPDAALRLNVGSTTDDAPHAARVHIADDGSATWDPYFLVPDMVDGVTPPNQMGAFPIRKRCTTFIEGLRRAPLTPWLVRPVAGRSSGLALYGLDQTYRDLAWTPEDADATRENLANLIGWVAQTRVRDGRGPFIADRVAKADALHHAAGPDARRATWPLDELLACLAHTAATIESAGDRPSVPFTFPVDSYQMMLRPALEARLGDMPGSGAAGFSDPAFAGRLESRFEWRRTTAFDIDLRAARPGGSGASDWRMRVDRFTVTAGGRTGVAVGGRTVEADWRFSGGRTDLESGHGAVLDRRTWLLEPPRFDGLGVYARVGAFGARVGGYQTTPGQGPPDLPAHHLVLGTVEWCPDAPRRAHGLDRSPTVGLASRCGPREGFGVHGGIDAVGLIGHDAGSFVDVGGRIGLIWADRQARPHLRVDLETHGQWDADLVPGKTPAAFQGAARISGFVPLFSGVRMELTGRGESFTSHTDDSAPYRLLYGRRHRRFGGSDVVADPHALVDDGLFRLLGGRVALHPPVECLSFDTSVVGFDVDWLSGENWDLSLEAEVTTQTMRYALLVGWYRLGEDEAERVGVGEAGHRLLLTVGAAM